MVFDPGYGETPISHEEFRALLEPAREVLDEPISKAQVYDLEQAVQEAVTEELLTDVLEGKLTVDELVSDSFVRELHRRLYGDIWAWAGTFRRHELNIGVAPELISTELRSSLSTFLYRWNETEDWTAREFGLLVHAETVRIHPFTDGNGRSTRLLADLVFVAIQDRKNPQRYSWDFDKRRYIDLLRQYDLHRDPRPLATFIEVHPLSE
ncbi:Fic family protein [Brevibacterium luteolum]|uniref:Fic family protein n=1 Tax=Brevibacterium luteolum TaxID=199591 RepID=UPI00223AB931|nr:Fic family protein [Brevibacterium luteolum]MCT1828639.1 Fic family protein [Brevibacterium luteolum]